jgi:two-component system, OmpR family, sensor histidine kinase KdpD
MNRIRTLLALLPRRLAPAGLVLLTLALVALTTALVALATSLLTPVHASLDIQSIALIYLFPVLLCTYLWGLPAGVLAAFTSFLVYNFFFIPPFYTLAVQKGQDLVSLIIFLIIAVVTSQLIGQARAGMQLARRREHEATQMYRLISALAGLQDDQDIARAVARITLEALQITRAEVLLSGPGGLRQAASSPDLPGGLLDVDTPERISPLRTARGEEGQLRLWLGRGEFGPEEERLLAAFSSQAALAFERTRLTRSETRAVVLEENDRFKTTLLSSVSHELRSPLAVIKASVSSLRSEMVEWNSSARHELLQTIEEETDHLNALVGNLLDMSRIEAGALKPQCEWNSLEEIARGVVQRMRKQLNPYRLELSFSPDLPLLSTDYVLMDQVFTNLIGNSLKFSPDGGLIGLHAVREQDCVHVTVTNQGPPVPPENLGSIFDKFNRLNPGDRITGTGLGLSICKGIIQAHGGKIWAQNSECCFEFHFTLPMAEGSGAPQVPSEAKDE